MTHTIQACMSTLRAQASLGLPTSITHAITRGTSHARLKALALALALATGLNLGAAAPAIAADKGAPTTAPPATAASATQKKAVKVKVDQGSAETPAQRNARLKRECKGRPNAGACLGFAS